MGNCTQAVFYVYMNINEEHKWCVIIRLVNVTTIDDATSHLFLVSYKNGIQHPKQNENTASIKPHFIEAVFHTYIQSVEGVDWPFDKA